MLGGGKVGNLKISFRYLIIPENLINVEVTKNEQTMMNINEDFKC